MANPQEESMPQTGGIPDGVVDPDAWATDVVVADGGVVHLRPLRHEDGALMLELSERLSDETVYSRFFTYRRPQTDEDLEPFLDLDYHERFALVAELDSAIVAVGRYMWEPERHSAEVAFVVEDQHQLRGIGSILLEHLAAIARSNGIHRFHATTMGGNAKMLSVFAGTGYTLHRSLDQGLWDIDFGLDEAVIAAVFDRELKAEAASVARVLAPGSVAVVGASREPGSIGNIVFRNIIGGAFTGTVFPVNPGAKSVAGVKAFPNLAAIPDPVDLVVVVVPAAHVLSVIEDAGDVGAKAIVVITAGFAETGSEGAAMQTEIVRVAHRHGMRLVGPNCVGVVNTADDVRLNATFAPTQPTAGPVGFASQSGALGLAILEAAGDLGLGLSSFVSVGNKADLSGNDLLQYWEQDPDTEVALMYLESFGNPRKFSRIARRFCRSKPLVVVKSGRSTAGQRAASSHTAALASDDLLADTLFRQAGIIRVTTLEQLFDVARLLVNQPLPAGRRVAIVGNSGGPGILAADACAGAGLEVPELSKETQAALTEVLTAGAGVSNPVDVIASGSASDYEKALRIVIADDTIDAVLVIFTDVTITDPQEIAAAIRRVVESGIDKPIAASFLSGEVGNAIHATAPGGDRRDVPVFPFPEAPAIALSHASRLSEWRQRPTGTVPKLDRVDIASARDLASRAVAHHPEGLWLPADELAGLLEAVGVRTVRPLSASSPEEARRLAEEIDGPVALKVISDTIQHKTDAGGVVLGLEPDAVADEYEAMATRLGAAMNGALVQPMIGPGVEVIIGAVNDPSFGPVVMFGLGGTATELFADRAFSIVPVTDLDAAALVRAPRSAALVFGHRGSAPLDVAALEDLVLRIGRLADAVPELAELDLNPVIARPDGAFVVDARARLEPNLAPLSQPIRRLDRPPR
jgi:acetyl coenzyme A synthetase (ADP forming)-like protein